MSLNLLTTNIAGHTKRSFANGCWFVFFAGGNIGGANIFFGKWVVTSRLLPIPSSQVRADILFLKHSTRGPTLLFCHHWACYFLCWYHCYRDRLAVVHDERESEATSIDWRKCAE